MLKPLIGAFAGGVLLALAVGVLLFGGAVDGGSPPALPFSLVFCLYPALWLASRSAEPFSKASYFVPLAIAVPPSYIAIGFIGTMNWTSGCAVAVLAPIWFGALWGSLRKRKHPL